MTGHDRPAAARAYQAAIGAVRAGNFRRAAEELRLALDADPDSVEYASQGVEIFRRAGRLAEALDAGRRAVSLSPTAPAVHNNFGLALQDAGDLEQAERCFRRAAELAPAYHRAHLNLGVTLYRQGRLAESTDAFKRALACKPDYPQALNGLAQALSDEYRPEQAVALFDRALSLEPSYAPALLNRGNALRKLGRLGEAEQSLRRALAARPNYAEAFHDLGALYDEQKRWRDAAEAHERALAIRPEFIESQAALVDIRRKACDWRDGSAEVDNLLAVVRTRLAEGKPSPLGPLASLRLPTDNSERLAIARGHAQRIAQRVRREEPRGAAPAQKDRAPVSPPAGRRPQTMPAGRARRLRIGFLSHEFGNNVVSHLMQDLYGKFDRDEFEVLALDYSRPDRSSLRDRVLADCDGVVRLSESTPSDAAARVLREGVDILIDINPYMPGGRPEIAALRPAPIQVSYMYPATTGADFIDYFLTDRVASPPGQEQFFTEKLVYLPDCYLPASGGQIAESWPSRAASGLPDEGFVYCSFNASDKIDSRTFDVWMRIVRRVPGSVLWQRESNAEVRDNLRREAAKRGVDAERLVFADAEPDIRVHLARHRNADLFVDTLNHGAHGTAVDALWAGLPLLTCPGETFASRVAASTLSAVGLTELIAETPERFEELAVGLAERPHELAELREKLGRNRRTHALFDTARLAKHLGRAFVEMWRRYEAGEPLREIVIGA